MRSHDASVAGGYGFIPIRRQPDNLEDGNMYLLISDTIAACIRYLLGSARGLAFVKRPTGLTLIARTGSG